MKERIGSVFISHSALEPDHSVTGQLAKALQEVGIDVWWDVDGLEGGDLFPVEILEAIIRQHYFLFIVSERSISSKWCQRELIRATELGKNIKPLILEPVPDEKSPLELAGLQYIKINSGIDSAMPAILKALGLGETFSSSIPSDPFARDRELLQTISDQLSYGKTFTDSLNLILMLEKIGTSCCETDRARQIFAGMRGQENWSKKGGMRCIDYDKVKAYLFEEWSK